MLIKNVWRTYVPKVLCCETYTLKKSRWRMHFVRCRPETSALPNSRGVHLPLRVDQLLSSSQALTVVVRV